MQINFLQKLDIQDIKKFKLKYFSVFIHKKLIYFKCIAKRSHIFSSGQLLGKKLKKFKFFKKSIKNYGFIISILNRRLGDRFKNINIFYCKNFNFKSYLWIKKFYFLYKPKINFFIISTNWNYIKKKKKRIKRKIYKKLLKTDSSV